MFENQASTAPAEASSSTEGTPGSAASSGAPTSEIEQLRAELKKKEDALTSKFHGLTARERMLMQKEQEIKQRLGQVGDIDELKSLAEKEPLKLLERFGLNYDKLTDIYAGMTPEDETKKTVGTLKREIEELKNKLQEDQTQGQMKEIMRVRDAKLQALRSLADKDDSEYTLVSQFGSYDDVLAYMSEHYNATGEILSDDEALAHVEAKLAEGFKKVASSPRVKKLLGIAEPETKEPEQARPSFGLHDSGFKPESARSETTKGLSDAQLFELALSKMPDLKELR